MTVRRLGLFGGTFDPPHFGHVAALRAAAAIGRFEVIEVTVAGNPYQKVASSVVRPASLRLAMARAAFDGLALVEVSDREIRREGPSYTIDTVRELLEDCDEVDLVVGADLVEQIDSWHEAAALQRLVRVGVVPRPGGSGRASPGWDAYDIEMDPVDLSSTFIRELAADPENLRDYVPASVIPLYESFQG
ncbi:MAG: nicotinate-nucleotide adenylyltransferase [Acidimicrobiales bacterium]